MRSRKRSIWLLPALVVGVLGLMTPPASAVPGDLLGTVTLPGNGTCNVTGTFTGTYYLAINSSGCSGTTIGVYTPPAGGSGAATLVATKPIEDGASTPVTISGLAWDPSRGKVWGAHNGSDAVYLIDIGDPTMSVPAIATFAFSPGVGGFPSLTDGLEWDPEEDTLWYSPDVSCDVFEFGLGTTHPLGMLVSTVAPKNASGAADCMISGVEVGTGNSLYIGRDGAAEIRRVDKTTGAFISTFATTSGRVEDLTCDPVTYAPKEAVLAKDAFSELYEAFEVEPGTCPLDQPDITLTPPDDDNEAGTSHTVTATISKGGQPVPGVLVSFSVVSGPNSGQVSDPGECSADPNCMTDANGQVSWTYTSNGSPGQDVIEACFEDQGVEKCARARKTWIETAGITLNPPFDENEDGTSHTVTATVTRSDGTPVQGVLVDFLVTSGPNAGEMSDPGECSVNANCTTDANGMVSWTYSDQPGNLGTDTIVACFQTAGGQRRCAGAQKRWVDTTPPKASCEETVNPHGQNTPPAGSTTAPGPKGGQNEDGFYRIGGGDASDPHVTLSLMDDGTGHVYPGPFDSGDKIKYTESNGAEPSQKKMGSSNGKAGAVRYHLTGQGDLVLSVTDASGNSTSVTCFVPPPPK